MDTPQKRGAGGRNDPVEVVVGHEEDVAYPVVIGDRDGCPARYELNLPRAAHERVGDAECQAKLRNVTLRKMMQQPEIFELLHTSDNQTYSFHGMQTIGNYKGVCIIRQEHRRLV
eukprot:scaffold52479_cov20-Prasinocladus_malaysianus.AAC.1